MARVLHNLLLFLIRLALKIRVLGYWSLIYGYCALCTVVALLKLCWNIVLRPTATFQWAIRETPPACLNDTSLGTHCYVRIKESGLRFHYVAAGERGKPLMLFLHGFPEFWFSWRYQLREFKSEFRVVAIDMRGYGESDLPLSPESYRFDYLVTDIKDIVEYLGSEGLVHQPQHGDREERPLAHGGGPGGLPVRTVTARSSDWSPQLLQECLQLSPPQPQPRQVPGAAAVGRAGRLPGAGDGRGVPHLHPESLPSQHHLRGQPLAAAGPARHCEHPHMDLPEGGRGTQKLQELKSHTARPPPAPPPLPSSPPPPWSHLPHLEAWNMPVIPSDIVITQSFFKPFHISDIFLKKNSSRGKNQSTLHKERTPGQCVCDTCFQMFFAHDIRLKSLSVTALQMCGAEISS
ncbi:uncharacterized protein ephx4 isoform X1 [Acanthopagrus latus]|uniref:uncharacterized protein ephx4 isoform X1 n=1 Tax=Acanthopagrus latus TaxID=8177 RepID=UPI00187C5406|nr:uncharacterized protein ephx4 isoform X1 [Acanthopagrus latus]